MVLKFPRARPFSAPLLSKSWLRHCLQELPLKRLQQQREDNGGQQAECKSCGEQAPVVAWCYDSDCDGVICQSCLSHHEKLAVFRGHIVRKDKKCKDESSEEECEPIMKRPVKCTRHAKSQELKYWCTQCSELVCPECLIEAHRDHDSSLTVEEARHSLETKMEELASLVDSKKQEFSEYLEKASKAESEALEYSELMKSEVNNVFDGIAASVEAQRNEALQSVSKGVKEIWSQKEMVEVSLAQLDSFTRFADHTHKCTADASYVDMAAQGIKLMERLKGTHGDESTLDQKKIFIVSKSLSLENVFALGQLSLKFSPEPGSNVPTVSGKLTITVSLTVGKLPVNSLSPHERCKLDVKARFVSRWYSSDSVSSSSVDSVPQVTPVQSPPSWQVEVSVERNNPELEITCQLTGDITTAPEKVTYVLTHANVFNYGYTTRLT